MTGMIKASDPKSAGMIFRRILRKEEGYETLLAEVRADPTSAMMALQHGADALGLNARGAADVLEAVLETTCEKGEDGEKEAATLMALYLTDERNAELLAGRGDLPSVSADLSPLPAVIKAVEAEMGEDPEGPTGLVFLRAWCMKLKDRPDYPVFLRHRPSSDRSFKELLLMALSMEATGSSEEKAEHITPDLFEEVGLDPTDEMQVFQDLLEEVGQIDEEELSAAQAALAERKAELERQAKKNEAKEAAKAVADELDL